MRCSRDTEKFPDEDIRVPKYGVLLYNINYLTNYAKVKISIFSRTFLKNHNFSFLGLIFVIHEVQNEDSLSRRFCSTVLDRDKMIKSSAYNKEFSFAPFGKTKGSDNVFSNSKGRSLI